VKYSFLHQIGFITWLSCHNPFTEKNIEMANFEIAKPTKLPPDGPVLCQNYTFLPKPTINPQKPRKYPPKPKEMYRIKNWLEYNKALVHKGLIPIWFSQNTLDRWYYQRPLTAGGMFCYSKQCI